MRQCFRHCAAENGRVSLRPVGRNKEMGYKLPAERNKALQDCGTPAAQRILSGYGKATAVRRALQDYRKPAVVSQVVFPFRFPSLYPPRCAS